MAEPVALIAHIKIANTNYKAFFKTKALETISTEMYHCIHYNQQDHYLYQYNKKSEVLYCFAFYNHGNADTLAGPFYQSLQTIAPFAQDTSYIATTLDAYNWTSLACFEVIENNKWVSKSVASSELDTVRTEAFAHWQQLEQPFVHMVFDTKIVDRNVVTKISALQEKHRLANLATFAKNATPLQPIHLFGSYYYNGKLVFSCKNGVQCYPQIDLATFKPTMYGAADANHVLVQNKCIATNPKKFKRLSKFDTVFYLSDEGVLDYKGDLIETSDSTTFKLHDYFFAEDNVNLYFTNWIIPKHSFTSYRTERHAPQLEIAITNTTLYYQNHQIAVDGEVFRFEKQLTNLENDYTGFIGSDASGLFVYIIENNIPQLFRSTETDVMLLADIYQQQYGKKYRRMDDSERIFLEKSSEVYRNQFLKKQHTDWVFYQMQEIRDYTHSIWQTYSATKNPDILTDFWSLYSIAEPYFWIEADTYKYLTLLYCELEDHSAALEALQKAIVYGAYELQAFLEHPDLAFIQSDNYFIELKDYAKQQQPIGFKIPMHLETIKKILSMPPSCFQNATLLWKYHLYDNTEIKKALALHPESTEYWSDYMNVNQQLFNQFFKQKTLIDMDFNPYKNYDCMPIEAYLTMFSYYLQLGESIAGNIAQTIPQLIELMTLTKHRIKQLTDETQQTYYKQLYNTNVVVQITEQYIH